MLAERCPGKEGQAKVDRRGIQGVGGFFEFGAEVFISIKATRLGNQDLAEVSIYSPVPFFVRLGKSAPRYSSSDAEMIELLSAETEARLNITKALSVGELGKSHAKTLGKARKTLDLVVALITINTFTKFIHGQTIHDLRKYRPARIHRSPLQ